MHRHGSSRLPDLQHCRPLGRHARTSVRDHFRGHSGHRWVSGPRYELPKMGDGDRQRTQTASIPTDAATISPITLPDIDGFPGHPPKLLQSPQQRSKPAQQGNFKTTGASVNHHSALRVYGVPLFLRLPYTIAFGLHSSKSKSTDPDLRLKLFAAWRITDIIATFNYVVNFFLYCLCGSYFRLQISTVFGCKRRRDNQARLRRLTTAKELTQLSTTSGRFGQPPRTSNKPVESGKTTLVHETPLTNLFEVLMYIRGLSQSTVMLRAT